MNSNRDEVYHPSDEARVELRSVANFATQHLFRISNIFQSNFTNFASFKILIIVTDFDFLASIKI